MAEKNLNKTLGELINDHITRILQEATRESLADHLEADYGQPATLEDMHSQARQIVSSRQHDDLNEYTGAQRAIHRYVDARVEGIDLTEAERLMKLRVGVISGEIRTAFDKAIRVARATTREQAWDLAEATVDRRHTDLILELKNAAEEANNDITLSGEVQEKNETLINDIFLEISRVPIPGSKQECLDAALQMRKELARRVQQKLLAPEVLARVDEALYIAQQDSFTDIEAARVALQQQKRERGRE